MSKIIAASLIIVAAIIFTRTESNFDVDYGTSEIYSRRDMDAAVEIIAEYFGKWDGCELHNIRYGGDDANNSANVKWMNDLAEGRGYAPEFTQCIKFLSDFHSPKNPDAMTSLNIDAEYVDWQWWLARADGGDWKLLTFGY